MGSKNLVYTYLKLEEHRETRRDIHVHQDMKEETFRQSVPPHQSPGRELHFGRAMISGLLLVSKTWTNEFPFKPNHCMVVALVSRKLKQCYIHISPNFYQIPAVQGIVLSAGVERQINSIVHSLLPLAQMTYVCIAIHK